MSAHRRYARGGIALATGLLAQSSLALASAPGVFGASARSAALATADVACPGPLDAGPSNPSAAAAAGLRLGLGHGYASMGLTLDGEGARVRDVSGTSLALQYGFRVGEHVTAGLALNAYLPDGALAEIAFRPATEPQLVLYEASLSRASVDVVAAARHGRVAVGAGLTWSADLAGRGARFTLGQDAAGTYADGDTDVELPYRVAPLVGGSFGTGPLALGAAFRGAIAVDLALESVNTVALADNPLNGDTTVRLRGSSGYDPARVDLGAELALGKGLWALGALEYAIYSAAPSPVADVTLDVRLGTTPGQREARFVSPRFRDTLSPRLAFELDGPAEGEPPPVRKRGDGAWALRAGYLFAPSPVPAQTGFTSYADAPRHAVAAGASVRLGRFAGVDLSLDAAAQLHLLATREERKPDPSLPHARYSTGGHILRGAATLEAAWQ